MIAELRDRIQWIYSRYVERRALPSWDEHRLLFDAIAAHDPESAAHIALHHIAAAQDAFTQGEAAGT
jgi:DNA-binding GntR family transcriptional regulator